MMRRLTSWIAGKHCPYCGTLVPLYLPDRKGRMGIRGPVRESTCTGCGARLRLARNAKAEMVFAAIMIFGMAGIAMGAFVSGAVAGWGRGSVEMLALGIAALMIAGAFLGLGLMSRVTRRVEKVDT